jgi:hypothetical protein
MKHTNSQLLLLLLLPTAILPGSFNPAELTEISQALLHAPFNCTNQSINSRKQKYLGEKVVPFNIINHTQKNFLMMMTTDDVPPISNFLVVMDVSPRSNFPMMMDAPPFSNLLMMMMTDVPPICHDQ